MNKRLRKYKLYIPLILIVFTLLAILPTSCTCTCFSGNSGVGGGWDPYFDQIAFVSDRGGRRNIYLMDYDGSDQTRITESYRDGHIHSLSWSSDGNKIAFVRYKDIWVVNVKSNNGQLICSSDLPTEAKSMPR